MTLVYLSLFWLLGVFLGAYLQVDARILILVSLLALCASIAGRRHVLLRLGAACLVLLPLGYLRYGLAQPPADYGSIALHVGPRTVEVGGVVVGEPDVRDQDTRLEVATYHIGNGQDSYKVSGHIQIRVPRYADVRYGDDLLLRGTLQEPPDNESFSYKRYLLRQGVYAIMYQPELVVLQHDQANHLLAALYNAKQRLETSFMTYLPEPQAGLAEGVLLGVKAAITTELADDLTRTGLTHIVVVSGYNMTVVVLLLQKLTDKRLRRSFALVLALGGVIVYTLMTGASAPVVRAAIMASMVLLARAAGRESDALTSLLFTAALLVGISPLVLWDVSFQLSFLATAGLVLLSPVIERALERLPLGIGAVLGTTLAAQIMTLPVIAFNFQRVSLISPLANLLVAPAIPLSMMAGAVVAVAGLTGLAIVRLAGWVTWLFTSYAVQVVHILARSKQAAVDLPAVTPEVQMAAIAIYFAILTVFFLSANYVQQGDVRALPQRLRSLSRDDWSRAGLAALVLMAVLVWAVVVVLVKTA